jgi:hypothetical protein
MSAHKSALELRENEKKLYEEYFFVYVLLIVFHLSIYYIIYWSPVGRILWIISCSFGVCSMWHWDESKNIIFRFWKCALISETSFFVEQIREIRCQIEVKINCYKNWYQPELPLVHKLRTKISKICKTFGSMGSNSSFSIFLYSIMLMFSAKHWVDIENENEAIANPAVIESNSSHQLTNEMK